MFPLWTLKDLPAPTIEEDREQYTPEQLKQQAITDWFSRACGVLFILGMAFVIGAGVLSSCNHEAADPEPGRVVVMAEARK